MRERERKRVSLNALWKRTLDIEILEIVGCRRSGSRNFLEMETKRVRFSRSREFEPVESRKKFRSRVISLSERRLRGGGS